jgi:predicted metal-dependent phosphoesterase TrpH
VSFREEELRAQTGSLGRRHLAEMLVKNRRAGSVHDAFHRYLGDDGRIAVPKMRLPVDEAIALVRGAGGVASWAHPAYDCREDNAAELRDLGLQALEVAYPGYRSGQVFKLRKLAAALGLAITGGSDCHGPEPLSRTLGACSVAANELATLRQGACP